MYPRLYMHSVQFAHFDNCNGKIYFESRKASGRHFQFILTRNQFFNLNDAIYQIKKFNYYGHFPLGNNTWLHYNGGSDTRLYRESFAEDCRVYFSFDSFMEYIKHTHPRLLSLVRLNQSAAAAAAATADRGERRRRLNARRRLPSSSISCSKSTNHKRSLSTILEPSHQSSDSKRHRGRAEWATASRSTDNDVLSAAEEESAILSKWERSSDRRRSDSDSSQSSGAEDRHSPASLRCDSPSVQTAMDYK